MPPTSSITYDTAPTDQDDLDDMPSGWPYDTPYGVMLFVREFVKSFSKLVFGLMDSTVGNGDGNGTRAVCGKCGSEQ